MRVRPIALLTVLVLAIAPACGSSPKAHLDASTGVRGRVTAGPTCPVERADQPCPPTPVDGRVDALNAAGDVKGSAHTDADGRYAIALSPGDYTLRVDTGSSFPRCPDTAVHVTSGAPTTADIDCDTGIR